MSLPAGSHTSTARQCAADGYQVTHCTPGVLRDIHRTKPFYAVPRAIFDHLIALVAEGRLKSRDVAIWLQAYMRSIGRPDDGTAVVYVCSYGQLEQAFGLRIKSLQLCLRRLEAARLAKRVFRRHQKGLILVGLELTLSYGAGQQILTGIADRAVPARRRGPRSDDPAVGHTVAETRPRPETPVPEVRSRPGGLPDARQGTPQASGGGSVARLVALAQKWGRGGTDGDNGDNSPSVDTKAHCPPEPSVQVKTTRGFSSAEEKPGEHGLHGRATVNKAPGPSAKRLAYANTSPLFRLSTPEQWYLDDRLVRLGIRRAQRERLMPEIAWSVTEDGWRCPRRQALEACVALVAAGRWRTPYSMRSSAR